MTAFLLDGWDDRMVSAINAVMAWVAACAHVYAAVKTSGKLRIMFVFIGSLALFYSFAYWWLFFNPDRVNEWSDFLRPVSIVAWILAWAIEPVILVKYVERLGLGLVKRAREAVEPVRKKLDGPE